MVGPRSYCPIDHHVSAVTSSATPISNSSLRRSRSSGLCLGRTAPKPASTLKGARLILAASPSSPNHTLSLGPNWRARLTSAGMVTCPLLVRVLSLMGATPDRDSHYASEVAPLQNYTLRPSKVNSLFHRRALAQTRPGPLPRLGHAPVTGVVEEHEARACGPCGAITGLGALVA